MSDSTPMMSDRARALLPYLVLALTVLALFGRVVAHPFIAFDDVEFILRNPQITRPWSSPLDLLFTPTTGYVIPVTVGFEALLYWISEGQPWSFHAAALALHALFTCQLFALARRLAVGVPFALAGALLFAVHPLVVQPVAWAICIKDLLMANLLLAATLAFLRSIGSTPTPGAAGGSVALALLAMLAKPSATLVGFAWLAYLLSYRHARPEARAETATPMRVALACAMLGAIVAAASRFAHDTLLDDQTGPWSPWKPVAVLGRQLWHVLWPVDLLLVYPDPLVEPAPAFDALGVAALLLAATLLVRLRASPAPLLLLALALATYAPTSNVLPFARSISDSYMYVPLSCVALLVAAGVARWIGPRAASARTFAAAVAAILGVALAASSSAQLPRWRGGTALWNPVVHRHPRLAVAHRLMGDELVFRGRPDLAVAPYRRAFALEYDRRFLLEYGTVLSMAGRLPDAECVLIEAAAFGSDQGFAVYNLAALLAYHPDYEPRHPGAAKHWLGRLAALRAEGKLRWPRALEAGLQKQLSRLRDAGPPAGWPQRNCAALSRE